VGIKVALIRELSMLSLGSAGVARELFWAEHLDPARMAVCTCLMLGPAAVWVFARPSSPERPQSEPGSRSPASRSRSRR
jgi:hypothetical protein